MRGILITNKGIEDIAKKEIKEIIGVNSEILETVVSFKCNSIDEILKLSYTAQTASKVLLFLLEGKAESVDSIRKAVKAMDFSKFLKKGQTFKVECSRIGEHSYTSGEISKEIGASIIENIESFNPKVDLKKPDVLFYAYVYENKFFLGIDLSGFDLSKRDYKVMGYMPSIKGGIAYALVRLLDYQNNKVLINPFAHTGVLCIEAALYAIGKSPRFYQKNDFIFARNIAWEVDEDILDEFDKVDKANKANNVDKIDKADKGKTDKGHEKLEKGKKTQPKIHCISDQFRHVKAAKANAKIAGINKKINFSKLEMEWLDTKFTENSVDIIAGNAPRWSSINNDMLWKLFKEMFYQARYVLKSKGKMGILTNKVDLIKEAAEGFEVIDERSVYQGHEELRIIIFRKP